MHNHFAHYTLIAEIAKHANRTTFLATSDLAPDHKVVVQVFSSAFFVNNLEQMRTLQVAHTLKTLGAPHLVPLLDAGVEEEQVYISSEYLTGGSLRVRLDRTYPQALPHPRALLILSQIGQALATLHTHQFISARLRPEHILFDAKEQAYLVEAYLSSNSSTWSEENEHAASRARYRAPEQFYQRADVLSDQYAFCSLAYELLTGQTPFPEKDGRTIQERKLREHPLPLRHFVPDLASAVDAAILKGLAVDPAQRHPDMLTLLAHLQSDRPWSTPTPSELPLPRAKRVSPARQAPSSTLSPSRFRDPSTPGGPTSRPDIQASASLPREAIGRLESSAHTPEHSGLTRQSTTDQPGASAHEPPAEPPASWPTSNTGNVRSSNRRGETDPVPGVPSSANNSPPASSSVKSLPTPVDEAKALLFSLPGDDPRAADGQPDRQAISTRVLPAAPDRKPAREKEEKKDDDTDVFETLLADFTEQEQRFLTGMQHSGTPGSQSPQADASPVPVAPAGKLILPEVSRAGRPGTLANASPSPKRLVRFIHPPYLGTIPRLALGAAALLLLLGGIVAYVALAAIPPSTPVTSGGSKSHSPRVTAPTLAVSVGSGVPTLSGTYQEYNNPTNLTTAGKLDWVHWGLHTASDLTRKLHVVHRISNYQLLRAGTVSLNTTWPIAFSWSNGTPITSMATTMSCIVLSGLSNGFSFTVQARAYPRTLRVYVGVYKGRGLLQASLDGGTSYSDSSLNVTVNSKLSDNALYTLTFQSNKPGALLHVTWSLMSGDKTGSVFLESAALSQ